MSKHRLQWDSEDERTVDDLYAEDAKVHLEQMDDGLFYLGVQTPAGVLYQVYLQADKPIVGHVSIHEDPLCEEPRCSRCHHQYFHRLANENNEHYLKTILMNGGSRMIVCQKCGDKRCPRAAYHENTCRREQKS